MSSEAQKKFRAFVKSEIARLPAEQQEECLRVARQFRKLKDDTKRAGILALSLALFGK